MFLAQGNITAKSVGKISEGYLNAYIRLFN